MSMKSHSENNESKSHSAGNERPSDQLQRAFVDDHQIFIQGLSSLLDALRQNDPAQAAMVAQQVDQKAGPHIQFEEEYFYPALIACKDRDFVENLYHEHELGREAVEEILNRQSVAPFSTDEQSVLIGKTQTALDHALTCGSLLSFVTTMDEKKQSELLENLHRCRIDRRHWSELPKSASSGASAGNSEM